VWLIDATAVVTGDEFDTVELTFNRPVVAGAEYNGQIGFISESGGVASALSPTGDLITPATTCTCPLGVPFSAERQWSVLIPDGIGPMPATLAYGDESGEPMPPQCLNVRYL